jgi:deoxyribodipyrimidine photo-lyase
VDLQRRKILVEGIETDGPVVYWMSREQRVRDNWALLYAGELARERKVPLAVVFTLSPRFLDATLRQYDFMLRGLEKVERSLARYKIPFFLLSGSPAHEVSSFVKKNGVGALVTDFSPLRIHLEWKAEVAKHLQIPFHEVDAHNIVPCRVVSDKREYSAATIRPKIQRSLDSFLEQFPRVQRNRFKWKRNVKPTDWKRVRKGLRIDTSVKPVGWLVPGEGAAHRVLRQFIKQKLVRYGIGRNDPSDPVQSDLSPYLHFGQISAQRVALEVMRHSPPGRAQDAFIEELVVRRELSDNFCLHTQYYDSVSAFPSWARRTLDEHRSDKREHTYSRVQFERAATHDPLWNAAQLEMVRTGKMHGYMRMYWAKKILEWTASPEQAMRIAIYLNDTYELDGRDPNGYAGIAWSIGGVHDRAWGERPIFGKVRYMSHDGCKRKFDIEKYITSIEGMK